MEYYADVKKKKNKDCLCILIWTDVRSILISKNLSFRTEYILYYLFYKRGKKIKAYMLHLH